MSDLIVRRCRMCGRRFEQARQATADRPVLYSLCKRCRNKLAYRRVDHRYGAVTGHTWLEGLYAETSTQNKEKNK